MIGLFQSDFNDLAICAFRYALGRKTYITSTISYLLAQNKDGLTKSTRAVICRDILRAIKTENAGHQCDIESWQKLYNCLSGEQDAIS